MPLVLLEPVGDVLQVDGHVFRLDGLLHGDHVHADAVAAGWDHVGDGGQRLEGHALKHVGHGWVLVDTVDGGVEELGRARHEIGDAPALDARLVRRAVVVVAVGVVVLQDARHAHALQEVLQVLLTHTRLELLDLLEGVEVAELHLVGQLHHVVSQDLAQAPVLGVGGFDAADLVRDGIGNLARQLGVVLANRLALVLGMMGLILLGHDSLFLSACYAKKRRTRSREYSTVSSMSPKAMTSPA